jgi:hypothetical protein
VRCRRVLPTRSLQILAVAVVACCVVLVACGDDGADDVVTGVAGDTNGQDENPPPDGSNGPSYPSPDWERIEETEDLVSPNVITPDELVVDPDDPNAVLVRFYGGVQECYGARATVTEETDELVRIRLETGGQPGAEDQVCITIAVTQELKVTLDEPVGERELEAVGV